MRPFHKKIPYTTIAFIHNILTLLLPRLSSFNKKTECHSGKNLPYSVNGNKTLATRRRPTYTIQHSENKQNTKILCKVKTSQGKINEMRENMQGNKTT